jgi:tRNA1(Val) A37 N6-methylase TrmN6
MGEETGRAPAAAMLLALPFGVFLKPREEKKAQVVIVEYSKKKRRKKAFNPKG